jgi:hypothetical protein
MQLEPGDKEIFASIQDEHGIDLELIRELQGLTPVERWERHKKRMQTLEWLRRAGEHGRRKKDAACFQETQVKKENDSKWN